MFIISILMSIFTSVILPIFSFIAGTAIQIALFLFTITIKAAYNLFMWVVDCICNYLNKPKPVMETPSNIVRQDSSNVMETDVAIPVSPKSKD